MISERKKTKKEINITQNELTERIEKMDMVFYKKVGEILKRERKKNNISLDQIVNLIGGMKTKSTLKRYEDGASRIDTATLKEITDVLNINYNEVVFEAQKEIFMTVGDTIQNFPLTDKEETLIIKYRKLDNFSRKAVDSLIDIEYERYSSEDKGEGQ